MSTLPENKDFQHYASNVLCGGDWTSHATKKTVDDANSETSLAVSGLLTWSPWEIKLWEYILSLWTDWVGTKLQIYMRQFENYFQEYNSSNKDEVNYAIIKEKTLELCERMIADLTAMLFDDGINGERVISFTDIIDTNTTDWPRAKIFFEAFKEALGKSIINNDALLLKESQKN